MPKLFAIIKSVKLSGKDERGVTSLEYGLIAGTIALAIVHAVGTLGTKISGIFNSLSGANW